MSVSRRTVGATLTGESATNPLAALAAAQVSHVAADPLRIQPVTGHDDAATNTHAHTVSAESAAAFQGSGPIARRKVAVWLVPAPTSMS